MNRKSKEEIYIQKLEEMVTYLKTQVIKLKKDKSGKQSPKTQKTQKNQQAEIQRLKTLLTEKDDTITQLNIKVKSYFGKIEILLTKIEEMEIGLDCNLDAGMRMKANLNELTERVLSLNRVSEEQQRVIEELEIVNKNLREKNENLLGVLESRVKEVVGKSLEFRSYEKLKEFEKRHEVLEKDLEKVVEEARMKDLKVSLLEQDLIALTTV